MIVRRRAIRDTMEHELRGNPRSDARRAELRLADGSGALGRPPPHPDPLRRGRAGAGRRDGRGHQRRDAAARQRPGRDHAHPGQRPRHVRRDAARRAVPPHREGPRGDGVPAAAGVAGAVRGGRVLPVPGAQRVPRRAAARRVARVRRAGDGHDRTASGCPGAHLDDAGRGVVPRRSTRRWKEGGAHCCAPPSLR